MTKRHIFGAILQFIVILMLSAGTTLNWVGYVYEGVPLISSICLTIVDVILLLFHATEYVFAMAYLMEKNKKEDTKNDD